jgi:hypothetical protein
MPLQIGIVGLPNVGKSTLFNALTRSHAAESANYPFCTIDPNVGIVEVPDDRLEKLAQVYGSEKIIPTAIEFVDIAGLVKGASTGEGLGNKFLANIRETDAICEVVRDFENADIQHVSATPDPQSDIEIIETELILADLGTIEKKLGELEKKARADKKLVPAVELLQAIKSALSTGRPANSVELPDDLDLRKAVRDCHLLTSKPFIYAVNVAEAAVATFDPAAWRAKVGLPDSALVVPVSAKLESELIDLNAAEAAEFLTDLNLKESSLNGLIRAAYETLKLITFFTAGPKETHAWTVAKDSKAPQAAGVIHTDFETGFIRSETVNWEKLVEAGSEAAAKEKGWIRSEGKEYVTQDGDVCHFRFNN